MGKNQHVVTQGDKWAVKPEGSAPTSVHETQRAASEAATAAAKAQHSELLVHGEDGQIRMRNSYGNDPYPPKG